MPIFNGRVVSQEFYANNIRGSEGIQGHTGASGPEGAPGISVTGETGIQGVTGALNNNIYDGLVTNISAISIANTNVETTILTYTHVNGGLAAGSQFLFLFQGTHQGQATSGTLTFRMYIGGTAGQTVQLGSQSSARAQTYCSFEGLATIRTTGSSGTYITSGRYSYATSATAQVQAFQGGASTTTVDTTASSIVIRITAQWTTASATNILLVQNACIERIK